MSSKLQSQELAETASPEPRIRGSALARHPVLLLIVLTLLLLGFFINKAVHLDDTLFLWTAKQIRKAPLDFYGFNVNWFGLSMPMTDATANPPLMGYYLALASLCTGWSEVSLHAWALGLAIVFVLGVYHLARTYTAHPLLTAVLCCLTPCFTVCATSLMCDILMAACWVWTLFFWERGLQRKSLRDYLLAGLCCGMGALAKYSALSLIPLMALIAILRARKAGSWIPALLVPVGILAGYEYYAQTEYGVSLFQNAADFSKQVSPASWPEMPGRLWRGIIFLGGSAIPALFLMPLLWPRRTWWRALIVLFFLFFGPSLYQGIRLLWEADTPTLAIMGHSFARSISAEWKLHLQSAVLGLSGLSILTLSFRWLQKTKSAEAAILLAWILGVLAFASVLNWTVNARSMLPLLPAAALLLTRCLEQTGALARARLPAARLWVGLGLSTVIAMAAALADYQMASAAKAGAKLLSKKPGLDPASVRFEGHWGFQYYLEPAGFLPLDAWRDVLPPGTLVVIPSSYDIYELPAQGAELIDKFESKGLPWFATMDRTLRAGFHSDFYGPLPFAFGTVEPQRFFVYRVVQPIQFRNGAGECTLDSTAESNANPRLAAARDLRQGNLESAILHLNEVLKSNPLDCQAMALLGQVAETRSDWTRARDFYRAALQINPDYLAVLNDYAWLLATAADASIRDGPEAVRCAERACAITAYRRPMFLGTLAAAYANVGRYGEAISTGTKAIALARGSGAAGLSQINAELLGYYRKCEPYRQK